MSAGEQWSPIQFGKAFGTFILSRRKEKADGQMKSAKVTWVNATDNTPKTVQENDIENLVWIDGGRRSEIRLVLKGGELLRFIGFPVKDEPTIKKFFESIDKEISRVEMQTNGTNCGKFEFEGDKNLTFMQKGKFVFELATDDIQNCHLPGVGKSAKTDCEIRFHEDDSLTTERDELVEMRVYFPNDVEEEAGDGEEVKPLAETFRQQILDRVDVGDMGQDQAVVEWPKTVGTFRVPNGRFQVEMFMNAMRLHGESSDYKILYKNIEKLFLLRQPGGYYFFIISLEVPLRRGQQRYKHLIWRLKDEMHEAKLNLSEELLAGKFMGKLDKRMEMEVPKLVSVITMHLTEIKVHTDESKSDSKFVSISGLPCLRCDMNNDSGFLYPLVRQFIFAYKPTIFVQYQDVDHVEFQRLDNANRSFDLLVVCKRVGSQPQVEHKFQNMDKAEFKALKKFLDSKKSIEVKTAAMPIQDKQVLQGLDDDDDDDESDDSDFEGGARSTGSADQSMDDGSDDSDNDGKKRENKKQKRDKPKSKGESKEKVKVEKVRKEKRDKKEKKEKKEKAAPTMKKRKKDPNAPKSAKSAYIMFGMDMRIKLKETDPELKNTDVMVRIGALWKEISGEDKKKYEDKAVKDKQRFDEEMKSYTPPEAGSDDEAPTKRAKGAKGRVKKDPNAPKKALSAYNMFGKEKRAQLKEAEPELKNTEFMGRIGALWKETSDDDKKKYQELADKDKERYAGENKEYKIKQKAQEKANNSDSGSDSDSSSSGSDSGSDSDSGSGSGSGSGSD